MNPLNRERPAPFVVSCGSFCRSAQHYGQVLRQFEFDTAQRYQPEDGATWCNIAAWDASRALACELPHWWDGREQAANDLSEWLRTFGGHYGWLKTHQDDARAMAALGHPTIVTFWNPTGHGHVAWVMPNTASADVQLAQAGVAGHCGYGFPLLSVFGQRPTEFWTHP